MLRLRGRTAVWPNKSRSPLKKLFSSDIPIFRDTLEYGWGLMLGPSLISTENPDFEMASRTPFLVKESGHGSSSHKL